MRKALFTSALAISLAVSALTAPNAQAVELPPVPDYLKLKIKQSAEHPPAPGENSNIDDKEAKEWVKQVKELFQKASLKEAKDLRDQLLKVDPSAYLHWAFPDLAKVIDEKEMESLDAEAEARTKAESPTEKDLKESPEATPETNNKQESPEATPETNNKQESPEATPETNNKQANPVKPETDNKQANPVKPETDNKQANPVKPETDNKQKSPESDADGGFSSDSAFGIVDVILSAFGTIGIVFGIGTVINNFLKSNGLPHF
ncbi:hypothetical protein HW450_09340 [Corynebacterium hindlerae]|uniref:Secreted protein n=1 Tax=Corynebacterium hindlerae TaxID=699041 RepID=A0A7G5FD70_9CORY|nr:hypothetical protein [Corynebacterium hindlerae]QMV84561.1 hypothetical protein HW450_09340 [Corynebacterium hindlerae]